MKTFLFIPCLQVEDTIDSVLKEITRYTEFFEQVLIIDNGSTDKTIPIIKDFIKNQDSPKYRLFQNERNYSLGGSTIIAFREALLSGADFLICLHSDGQAKVSDLKKFFPLKADEDFVLGSRFLEASDTQSYSPLRKVANHLFFWLQKIIVGKNAGDFGVFPAFNLRRIEQLPYEKIKADMAYHPALILYAHTKFKNLKIREFPIYWGGVQTSHINPWSYGFSHLIRIIKIASGSYRLTRQTHASFQTREVKMRSSSSE